MIRKPLESLQDYLLDRMVLRPSRHPIDFAPKQRVMLEGADSLGDSAAIECFVESNFKTDLAEPQLLILKFPGTAGRGERASPFPMSLLDSLRITMWTWNPPGYGRSHGRASLHRIGNAAIEFWQRVTRRYDAETPIWQCGNSLGCVSALNVAASEQPHRRPTGLILRNPPPLKPVVKRVARRYPLGTWFSPVANRLCDSMNAMATARRCHDVPAVFLQSELDGLVPVVYQNRLIRAYQGPKRTVLMEGLGHGGIATESHEPLIKAAVDWLRQSTHLPPATADVI